ncbi:molybdopterin-dependent oxidoreductase [Nonomuraea phyllanthi]|uniref:Molybdopterin-dependent oxidoreductase n=1 Tax=Nonomuraea phyllanthi TaxID=2219224 RepID=A0A5C4VIS1_9ACTN|nr:molybdopterin-dependent oxidoreductase [Nonomuraea phyllanthi]
MPKDNAPDTVSRLATCNLCEAMCGLRVDLAGDRVTGIRGDVEDPLSRGHICPKAVALQDVHNDPDRLRSPVRRTSSGWAEISWDEALDLVADRLAEIRDEHGADAVATFLGNPVLHSLGAMTHVMRLVRLLRTRNRFSATSVDNLPSQLTSYLLYGHQWLHPVPDLDRTSFFLVFGANPVVSNGSLMSAPNVSRRLRALRERGGRMVVFDPRRTETAKRADEHHFVRPGTDAALILAMAQVILTGGPARPAPYVDGLEQVRRALEDFTPERAAQITGVAADTIRRLAREFAAAESAACYGRVGVSTQRFGALCQWGIQLLNLITGNLDRPGGTLMSTPALDLVGGGQIDAGGYDRWRSRVRGLPEFAGEFPVATLAEEITTPGTGRVRALLTVSGNPVLSTPGGHVLSAALAELEFMAGVDFYINETTRHADVILPPTHVLERDHYDLIFRLFGIRDTARYTPAVLPKPTGALDDWEIFSGLAERLGNSGPRVPPARIVDLGLAAGPYDLTLAGLGDHPHGLDLGPLKPSLPGRLQTPDQRINAAPALVLDDIERARTELLTPRPATTRLLLIGRRHLRDANSWLHNSARLTKGRARHHLLMNPADMEARGLSEGDLARVQSWPGEVTVPVAGSDDLMPGVVSLPHGFGHVFEDVRLAVAREVGGASANDLTDPMVVDRLGGTSVLNGVPVTVGPAGES